MTDRDAGATLTEADFERLLDGGRVLTETLDLPDLLKTILGLASGVVRSESSSLFLVDGSTGELAVHTALGSAGERVGHLRLQPGEGLAGWVAAHQSPLIVNDVRTDPRWSARGDADSRFVTRQVVAAPLIHAGKVVGVLEGINKRGGEGFTPLDARVLGLFAAQAAVAIEKTRLYDRLKNEKETLLALIREMSDGAVLADAAGRVTLVNAAAAGMIGGSEAPGGTLEDLFRAFEATPPLKAALSSTEPVAITLKRSVGKELCLEGVLQPLREGGGRLWVFRDVTEIRREDLLKKNFLSVISHKLKTPLVAITGFAPMLLADPDLKPVQRQGLTAIRDQGQKLAHLVEKLLRFATVESHTVALSRRRSRARTLLEVVRTDLAKEWVGRNAVVEFDESLDALPALSVDPDRFSEVFRNLLDNAVKFNTRPEKRVRVYARVEGAWAFVSVEDEGPGVPPEDHSRIFKKFYQVESEFTGQVEGVGLGLALSRRIVEDHGGSIGVRSVMGSGSVFTTRWPLDDV